VYIDGRTVGPLRAPRFAGVINARTDHRFQLGQDLVIYGRVTKHTVTIHPIQLLIHRKVWVVAPGEVIVLLNLFLPRYPVLLKPIDVCIALKPNEIVSGRGAAVADNGEVVALAVE